MFPTQLDKPEGRGTVDASSRAAEAQETIIRKCATLLKMERWRVAGAIALFDDGSTIATKQNISGAVRCEIVVHAVRHLAGHAQGNRQLVATTQKRRRPASSPPSHSRPP